MRPVFTAACMDMLHFFLKTLATFFHKKKLKEYPYVCMHIFSFFLNNLFSSLILSLLNNSCRVGFLLFFLPPLPVCTAWHRFVLSYPSVNKSRPLISRKKCWMNHPAFLPFPFFPSLQHICIAWKTALLWNFAEVHYIISKLGLLSAFCSELAVVAFILLQFAVIMGFGTFWGIFFVYLEQQEGL